MQVKEINLSPCDCVGAQHFESPAFLRIFLRQKFSARVAKLADALDSESSVGNDVQVQVLSRALR